MNFAFVQRFWPYLLAYSVLAIWSCWQFPWHLSSSDAAFYLMNGQELAHGDLWASISSYWSPLWSWLMVPFFWIGLEGLWPMKLLQLLIGLWGLSIGLMILDRLKIRDSLVLVSGILLVLSIWMMQLSHTPDLLMAVLLLQYFFWLWIGQLQPLRIGLIGAALFWCKSFGFPFFVAHFLLWTGWRYWQSSDSISRTPLPIKENKSHKIIRQGLASILIFGLLSGAWMGLMAAKFGWIGLGTSGTYNMAYMGPIMNFQPPYFDHFISPDGPFTRQFVAEEQGLFGDYGTWSPFADASSRAYYLNHLSSNLSKLYYISFLRDGFLFLILFLLGWSISRLEIRSVHQDFLFQILLFLGIYGGGYFLLFPNERYLWIANLLLIPVLMVFFNGFRQMRLMGGFQLICLVIIFGVNNLAFAGIRLQDHEFYEAFHLHESEINTLPLSHSNVVSNRRPYDRKLKDHMDVMSYLAYQDSLKVWGLFNTKTLEKEGLNRLQGLPIDYFLLWDKVPHVEKYFQQHSLIAIFPEIDLRIYQLNR